MQKRGGRLSVKGIGKELYIGKQGANIITFWGNKKKIDYNDLEHIDYMFATLSELGYINFVHNDNYTIRFDFKSKSNEKILKAINYIHERNPELALNEYLVSDLKLYERWWFMVLTTFFCCAPVGLFLMWYKKKSTFSFRITLTLLLPTLWIVAAYASYLNYIYTMDRTQAVIAEYTNNLTGNYENAEAKGTAEKKQTPEEYKENSDKENSDKPDSAYGVGDIYEDDSVKIMYLNCGDYAVENEYLQPEAGNKYIFAEFSVENVGEADYSAGYSSFRCYADDTECSSPIISSEGAMPIIATLSPGRNTKGKIFYEVPKDAKNIEIEYETNIFTQDKIYFSIE